MADLLNLIPLFPSDDEAAILARMIDWANEGVDPSSADWVDTREGGFWRIGTMGSVKEIARLYDLAGTEVVAAAHPLFAWGEYLDDHAEVANLERLAATPAEGEVTFTGTNGTLVASGTVVAVVLPDPDADELEYETTDSGTITGGVVVLPVAAVVAGSASNVGAAAVTELVTPVAGVDSVTNASAIIGGTDTESDDDLRDRLLAQYAGQGGGNKLDYERWSRDYPGVGIVTVIPLGEGPGTVTVIIFASDGSPASQSVVDGLQDNLDPFVYVNQLNGGVTLPTGTITVDSTSGSRAAPDMIRVDGQAVAYTGKTGTTFTGCTGGSGAVADNAPVTQSGAGEGRAPIGHHVHVLTGTVLDVDVTATVELDSGYSLDGAGGTVALQDVIDASLASYVNALRPGDEIVLQHVTAAIVDVEGVHDAKLVKIEGSAANYAIPATPVPQVPILATPSVLTEGAVP